MRRQGGLTMLELLITLVVLAVLVAMAVPSFTETMDRNAATTAANDLLSSILLARSEAVKREQTVTVGRKSTDWSEWRVFADDNADGAFDSGEDELADHGISAPITATSGNLASAFSFNSRGRASLATSDQFTITQGNHTRYVCFSATGRPRVQDGTCP